MSNTLGSKFRVTIFGQSHSPMIGAVSRPENCPPPRMSLWPLNLTAAA